MRRRPTERRLLAAGAALNGAIVGVWLLSRLVGLPVGPERWQPEAIGAKDLLASYAEIAIVLLVVPLLRRDGRRLPPRWFVTGSWVIAGLGVVAAFIAGH